MATSPNIEFTSNPGNVLQAGQTAPDFDLPDSTGTIRRLSEFMATGPVVLLFYRGHW